MYNGQIGLYISPNHLFEKLTNNGKKIILITVEFMNIYFLVIIILFLVWLIILTFLIWKEWEYLKQLFPKSDTKDIRNKFKELVEVINKLTEKEEELVKNFSALRKESEIHVQKVAIVRYNPYGDTGGDQSFSLAILNNHLDGFILTSLHSRSGTRVYAKPVSQGKSQIELSKEEQDVLMKASSS